MPTPTAALTLVILVARGASGDPATTAMQRAVGEALGAATHIVVQEVPDGTSDDDALAIGRAAGADAVAELVWRDDAHRHATLHVHVGSAVRWADRDIGFDTPDAEAERGRTVGFALASMMPEPPPAPPLPPAPTPSEPPPVPEEQTPPARHAPSGAPLRWRGAVDAAAIGDLGGGATGGGGAVAGRWDVTPRASLRVAAALREGRVGGANATSLVAEGALGVVLHVVLPTTTRGAGVSVRADLLAIRDQVTRPPSDGGPSEASLWLPGGDVLVEGSWVFGQRVSAFVGAGMEAAFGSIPVVVHDQTAATLPPIRAVAELGVRVHF